MSVRLDLVSSNCARCAAPILSSRSRSFSWGTTSINELVDLVGLHTEYIRIQNKHFVYVSLCRECVRGIYGCITTHPYILRKRFTPTERRAHNAVRCPRVTPTRLSPSERFHDNVAAYATKYIGPLPNGTYCCLWCWRFVRDARRFVVFSLQPQERIDLLKIDDDDHRRHHFSQHGRGVLKGVDGDGTHICCNKCWTLMTFVGARPIISHGRRHVYVNDLRVKYVS